MESGIDDATLAPFDVDGQAMVDGLIEHLNAYHADTVLLVARHARASACDAGLAWVDRRAAAITIRLDDGATEEIRLDFPHQLESADEVQPLLLDAVNEARAAADASVPLTSIEQELRTTATLRAVHGRLGATRRIGPNLLEVTLTGFHDYPLAGGDEFVYVMVSAEPGGIAPTYGMDDYLQQVEGDPVRGAYYTVRRSRPQVGEIDLWVVEHDHPGSVGAWFAAAHAGDPIALWGPRAGYQVPTDAEHVLFVADESGFAAVAALLEQLPPVCRATAVLETADAAHRPALPSHARLELRWVDRGPDAPGVTNRLLAEVVAAAAADPPDAAFGAAESRQITAVRRHVREVAHIPAARVLMTGYWRRQHEAP